jgi:hypothetical protein
MAILNERSSKEAATPKISGTTGAMTRWVNPESSVFATPKARQSFRFG